MQMELQQIGPVSAAKVLGVFYAAIGLVAGAVAACIVLVGAAMGNGSEHSSSLFSGLFGVGAVVLFPILYGGLGALGGLIFCALYNVIARLVGGIQMTLR
jgi:hypothetical protein